MQDSIKGRVVFRIHVLRVGPSKVAKESREASYRPPTLLAPIFLLAPLIPIIHEPPKGQPQAPRKARLTWQLPDGGQSWFPTCCGGARPLEKEQPPLSSCSLQSAVHCRQKGGVSDCRARSHPHSASQQARSLGSPTWPFQWQTHP